MLRVTSIHGGTPSGGGGSAAGAVAQYLTGYLTAAGEEPGVWVGDAARRLALEGPVQRGDLVAVLEGRDPRDGTALGRLFQCRVLGDGRVVRPVIGFDATFSAPKSVSVMWALTQDPGWAEAHDRAVLAVVEHVQAHGATTRVRIPGGREYPDTRGLIVAVFRQHTSRADDPQLHTHTFISSKVQTDDGGWWALDARYLKRYQRALGGLYQTVLRAELTARYGVSWGPVVNGQAELADMPPVLVEQFSKRSSQVDTVLDAKVEAFTARNGRVPTGYERAALVREAALDSRDRKTGTTPGILFTEWATQAVGVGWDRDRLTTLVAPVGRVRDARQNARSLGALAVTQDWVAGLGDPGGLYDRVTETVSRASTWHRGDVLRAVTDLAVPPGVMAGERWAVLVEEVVDGYLAGRCVSVDPPHPGGSGRRVRGSDGRDVRTDPSIGPYTTAAILAQEEHLLVWALDHTPDPPAPSSTTPRVLSSGTRLDPDQHAAAAAVAGRDRLVLVVGPAGTGKTSTLAAAVVDLEAQGRAVFGVAPSNQAAHVLASETGMPTDSVAKLLYEHGRPDRPAGQRWQHPGRTTLVVDETGMLPTGDLHQLTVLADRYGWRLVLVGDPYQLPAVGRGGMFGELAQHTRPIELARVRRFTSDWEGPASLALRRADPGVVGTYEHHGRISVGTFDEHAVAITRQWLDHTAGGRTVAVTAATNDEVDRLNTAIQTARLELGQLDTGRAVAGGGGERLHPGDVVATRQNRRDLTSDRGVMVKNRAQWTITHTHPTGEVTLRGADGTITLPTDYTREHVRLAYANTVYGTQGATVDQSITLVSGATDHRNLYVGATRGRDTNELYVIADTMEDARDTLEAALVRDRVDTPAVAVRRELLEQTSGMGVGVTTQEDWTPTTRTPQGGEGSPRPVAGRTPKEPALDPSDPFAGLETVHHALQRLLAEQATRQAPRDAYQTLERDLGRLQVERERLDRGPRPYEHGPLDRVHTVRNNAGVDVSQLASRLEHAPWRDRRHIRHLLADATQRLEQAETAYQTAYQHEIGRLEPLIETAKNRLEHTPRPEPIGPRDQELERGIGWLHWEDSVGNGGRPTLEALHDRRDQLEQAATQRRPLTPGEQAVYGAVVGELDGRDVQYQTAVEAQQQAVLAQQQALQRPGRDLGPDLGL